MLARTRGETVLQKWEKGERTVTSPKKKKKKRTIGWKNKDHEGNPAR